MNPDPGRPAHSLVFILTELSRFQQETDMNRNEIMAEVQFP
jgi:hypothetical protein